MKTVISVKVDKDVRDKARKTAKKLGLPLSLVVNGALRKFAEEQRVEFSAPLIPNAKTAKILRQAIRDIEEGNMDAFSPAFTSSKDAVAWLNSKK
jgi:antitoxin component of RelBE/YafQ-DinJ toxin-antitoxin module